MNESENNEGGLVESPVDWTTDGSETDEVPLEPFFNYSKIEEKDVQELLRTDTITATAVHDKFLALGTQLGYVYIMSHEGTMDHAHVPKMRPHRTAVSRMDVEAVGNYVITCATDGRVVISGIGTSEMNHVLSLQIMPRAVAIAPNFSKPPSAPVFVMGERNLTFYEKKFIFRYKETVVFRGAEKDGFISRISWCENHVAFTNDSGTRIYDKSTDNIFTIVSPSHDVDRIRSSRFPPSHCWLSENSLAIGWADTVTVVNIVCSSNGVGIKKYAEIPYIWHLNGMFLSGISYVASSNGSWEKLVLFGLRPPEGDDDGDFCDTSSMVSMQSLLEKDGPVPIVQVTVVSPVSAQEYRLQSEDRLLGIEVKSHSQPNQFSFAGLPAFNSFFITGPKVLITANPYGALNAVKFRMEKGQWEEAFELAREKAYELEDTNYDCRTVGRCMIEHYLNSGRPRLAAAKLGEVCGESRGEWEWAVQLFEQSRVGTLLAEIIPTSNPQLEPECYESVLLAALWNDTRMFRRLVQAWSPDLYRAGSLSIYTLSRLRDATTAPEGATLNPADELNLDRALAHLYLYERKFDQAIKIYMLIKDVHIFNVIDKYQLFDLVKDQISELMSINTDRALRLLLDNEDSVSPQLVMSKIALQPKLQMAYLNKLFGKDQGAEFADRAVQLYAEHDRPMLSRFFKKNEHYNISRALEICTRKGFTDETILLLGKSGNHLDALDLMMREHKTLDGAINYCKEHEDPDLWSHLVEQVVENPEHIVQLLNQAGSSIDPLFVIQNIPGSLEIPGLRDALAKILTDCASRVELLKGCRSATYADTQLLLSDFLRSNRRTTFIGPRSMCTVCGRRFLSSDGPKGGDVTIFGCGHVSHSSCCAERVRRFGLPAETCVSCSEGQDELVA